jgi:raffinose/stachyose/melibiose transport system permease protein
VNKAKFYVIKFIKYLALIIVAALQLYPLFWLFIFSLKDNNEIFVGNPMGLPKVYRWENYVHVFQNANIGLYLRNSVIITFASIAISTVLATMASYAIARMKWKLSNAALVTFLSGMMIPLHAVLVPLLVLLTRTQLTNTFWSLILPYTAFALPMAIYIFVGFFGTLPRELEEAACIDGLNIYGIFLKIMLPLIRPAIATVSVFTYLACWNELMFAVSFNGGSQMATITIGIMNMAGTYASHMGRIGAGLAVATAPTLIIYVVLSKQIQKSFTTGALKG